jgi:hypothetical protein
MNRNLEAPKSLSAAAGEINGEINLQWDAVEKANAYIVEVSKTNNPGWEQADFVYSSRCTISGLEHGTAYSFRVSAVNSSNQSKWSKVVTKNTKKFIRNLKIVKYEDN